MYKLSIIVPVYNRETKIKRCLDSIVNQLNENVELVIVNDGSTDNTDEVISSYIKNKSSNIQYYTKQNAGIAHTRNFGIEHANGQYIIFVDSDDYIDKDLIKVLDIYMKNNIDLIKYKLQRVDEKGNLIQKQEGPVFEQTTGEEAFNNLAFSDVLLDSPCVYAMKKNLFNDYKFKEGTEHEDFGLIPLIILKANTVISINYYGYNYVQSDESITRNTNYEKTIKKFEDTLKHYDNMKNIVEKENLKETTKKNVKTYYTNAIILKLKELETKDQKKYIKQIRKRGMQKNIQVKNIKQLIKKVIITFNMRLYLKFK